MQKVSQFISKYIHSIWHLELILFLRANGGSLTPSEIAQKLYLPTDVIENALCHFAKEGLFQVLAGNPGTYTYAPVSSELSKAVDETSKAYLERRMTVIDMIFTSPGRKTFFDKPRFPNNL